MAKPLDKDFRVRVVAAVESSMSRRPAAARAVDISESAAVKLMRRYRSTGSIAPRQMGDHRRLKLAAWRDWLMQRLGEKTLLRKARARTCKAVGAEIGRLLCRLAEANAEKDSVAANDGKNKFHTHAERRLPPRLRCKPQSNPPQMPRVSSPTRTPCQSPGTQHVICAAAFDSKRSRAPNT
ncbi:MAG: hypothetical protein AB7U78_01615 [Hyphomicrobiaceae bacterium]